MAIRITSALTLGAALAAAGLLSACDQSPQSADGAVEAGDPGVATATESGTLADTGRDTGAAGGDVGGAGELTEDDGAGEGQAPATTQ